MRPYSFLIIFLWTSFLSAAQKIKGVVTDRSGNVLPYASVYIKETNKGTNANSEGKYSLKIAPGNYTVVCQHVGYKKEEAAISLSSDIELNFILQLQDMTLKEVVLKNGEDPAYAIIRNTIRKKSYYNAQLDQFTCEVYTKGQLRLRSYPKKIFGQKVDFEDGDTSLQKIVFLSETVSRYSVDKPQKEKIEVISSKVSGQSDGFGLSAPQFFSFYENNIFIGNNLNPRGFISPIAENALNYYRYKLEGTYFEDGKMINHIKVIPRRTYEPLFSGYIDIVDEDWRIYSTSLLLTKASQMQLVDSLRIEQLFRSYDDGNWYISSQVIYPSIKLLGFDAYGSFINIYSDFNSQPGFTRKSFGRTVLKYLDSANKKNAEYWDRIRPVPLMADEVTDYRKKDSLEIAHKDPHYLDSIDRKRNKASFTGLFFLGHTFNYSRTRSSVSLIPVSEMLSFNPAEGWVVKPAWTWSKRLDTTITGRRAISISPVLRYGFSNHHFNSYVTTAYSFGKKYANTLIFSGGSRVFQFNNNSPLSERGNTAACLMSEKNRVKTYEAIYFRGSYRKGIGEGLSLNVAFQYQDRKPLDNTTDYTWRDKESREYSPNYPVELLSENIKPHQVFFTLVGIRWQPGTKYIELPERKVNVGSSLPVFSLQYVQAFRNVLGSDLQYSKWKLSVTDHLNLRLLGKFGYKLSIGGFLNKDSVQVPDFNHFNGNTSRFAAEYLNSFQILSIYQFSNTSRFYSLAHLEHNFNGFLTNKIPGIRKLNIYLVVGANAFHIKDGPNYVEVFGGIDNIFKQIRVDLIHSYLDGKPGIWGVRVGLRNFGRRGEEWP